MAMDDDDGLVLAGYDELMGRVVRPRRGMIVPGRRRAKLRQMADDLPAAGGRVLRQFLGWPLFVFNLTSTQAIQQTTRPQRSIQLDRLVADVTRIGATSTGQITMTKFKIGAEDMLSGNDGLPIGMFAAAVTSGRFKGYTAKGGIDVVIALANTVAVTTTDSVTISIGAYGDAIAG